MNTAALETAKQMLEESLIFYQGRPIGTVAANDPTSLVAENYADCFVRDFFSSALVFLNEGKTDIVRNFLEVVLQLSTQQQTLSGHEMEPGVMPASFRVETNEKGKETLLADFGERAIGRVAPVDSMMWWTILLGIYVRTTGDDELVKRFAFQDGMRQMFELLLKDTYEVFPTLLVPEASFMIDRRMGVYGHPLEVQALFYGALDTALEILQPKSPAGILIDKVRKRYQILRSYVRIFYWVDLERLNEIHRFKTEEFGTGSVNMLNIYPESVPYWVADWLPDDGGYLVGNLGPGRMDFRFFSQGNLLAIVFGLATEEQTQRIMDLFEKRWSDLIGSIPVKICYPALEGEHWKMVTGSDPKNIPWSYHNGGNWPVILWPFVAAALKAGRRELAEKALDIASEKLILDEWPEYYDGRRGRLIGRRANLKQTWSATALILAHQWLQEPKGLNLFPGTKDQ